MLSFHLTIVLKSRMLCIRFIITFIFKPSKYIRKKKRGGDPKDNYRIFRKERRDVHKFKNLKCAVQASSFLLPSVSIEESIDFVKIFDFRFLMNLHIFGYPEHDFTISGNCLSVSVCETKNFVVNVARKLILRIS